MPFFNTQRANPASNHSGSGPAVPSYMLQRYYTVWGESLSSIAASHGIDPRQLAAASGIDPYWHHLDPLPPGTQVAVPFVPMPHRTIIAASQDPSTDPRGPVAFPDRATQLQARTQQMPYPYGV